MKLLAIIGLFIPLGISAQDTLQFNDCIVETVENSPRLLDKDIIDEQGRLTQENLESSWFPELTVNGKYSYQSDVFTFDMEIPNLPVTFPEVPHSQYGLNIDLKQTIYDGGITKKRKEYELRSTAASRHQVDVDIHSLKTSVMEVYFTVLLLQEKRNTLEIVLENLSARDKQLNSAFQNGILEQADQQLIKVEILKTLQAMSELDGQKRGLLRMLSIYMGKELSPGVFLATPNIEMTDLQDYERPELTSLDLQSDLIDAGIELKSATRMPVVYAFGQAGMGMPGYNYLNTEFDTYYMVGAGLQWKIWDWNESKREQQILEKQKDIIEHSRENFTMGLDAGIQKEIEQMKHLKNALSLDNKMLQMRIDITKNASSKLNNGTLSATDYLQTLNEESRTRVQKSTHKLQLIHSMAKYNNLKGTL